MKNKFLMFIVLTLTLFIGLDSANAIGGCNGQKYTCCTLKKCDAYAFEDNDHVYWLYDKNNTGRKKVFCLDRNYNVQDFKALKSTNNIVGFLNNYEPLIVDYSSYTGYSRGNKIGNEQITKALLKKIAIFKWYIYNNPEGKINLSENQKYSYTKNAIWDLLFEVYKITTSNLTGDGNYSAVFSNASKWYENHKNEFGEPYGVVWQSSDNENQPLIDVDIDRNINYDYSIDMACTNCDSTNFDSKAFVIQDTTNWEAIVNSESLIENTNCKEIGKTYFKANSNTFCREEYHVYFPNANNKIVVQLGRYFTVNASAEELNNEIIAEDIPNFQPIKVTRVRQCKGGDLNQYNKQTCETFKTECTGDIKLKYNESKYGLKEQTLVRRNAYDSANCNINDDMLVQEVTYSYTLPNNIYRYIRKVDGKALKQKPTDNDYAYTDLGIGTLPVSFGETKNSNDISVQLAYELPSDKCSSSKIASLYSKGSCYKEKTKNVYQRFLDGEVDPNEKIGDSACAKLYGTTNMSNKEFSECVKGRTSNKSGKCIDLNKIVNNPTKKDNYLCDTGDDCDSPEDAKKQGRSWNTCLKVCCPLMHKFNSETCTCEPSEGGPDDECTKDTIGRSWNETTQQCCPVGQVYDANSGTCKRACTKDTIGRSWNETTQQCCPIGQIYNANSGTCVKECSNGKKLCNGVCMNIDECPPHNPVLNPVYRVISLENPFIGQNGWPRKTGSNWCSYDSTTNKTNCNSDNPTVKAVIPDNKTTYSEDEAMYKVTLDSKTISEIRNYNSKHKYEDWDLKCLDNGSACISDFIHDTVKVTGKCSNVGKDSFYSCAD